MKTLAIISQKGGVGKTTIATALAVAAEKDGKIVAVFDLDPQASAAFWKDTREADTPAVVAIPPSRLQHVLKAARPRPAATWLSSTHHPLPRTSPSKRRNAPTSFSFRRGPPSLTLWR